MKKHSVHTQQQLANKIVRRTSRRGTLFVAVGAIFWAMSGACGQFLMQTKGINSEWLATVRILTAGLILSVIGATQNRTAVKSLFKNKKDLVILFLYGSFGLMLAQYAYLKAIAASNAGTGTVLQYIGPIFIIIFVCIRHLRLPTVTEAVSIVLAIMGVFLIATHGNLEQLAISRSALFWGLLSAAGFMNYSLLAADIIPKYGSILITGLGMLCGGIVLMFITRPWQYEIRFDLSTAIAFIGLVFIGTTVGYTLYMQGVSDIGAVKASMVACIEPVSSAVFATFLGTRFVWWQDYAGILCIIATVFILSIPTKHLKISFKPSHKKEHSKKS